MLEERQEQRKLDFATRLTTFGFIGLGLTWLSFFATQQQIRNTHPSVSTEQTLARLVESHDNELTKALIKSGIGEDRLKNTFLVGDLLLAEADGNPTTPIKYFGSAEAYLKQI